MRKAEKIQSKFVTNIGFGGVPSLVDRPEDSFVQALKHV